MKHDRDSEDDGAFLDTDDGVLERMRHEDDCGNSGCPLHESINQRKPDLGLN